MAVDRKLAFKQLVDVLRQLDPQDTGEISLVALDSFFQRLDSWWDTDKLEQLSTAAGIISENGYIRYEDFLEWLLSPATVPPTPRTPRRPRMLSKNADLKLEARPESSVTLRFVHINDVYDLMRFPSLKTAIAELNNAADADKVVTTLGGDFLAPYLLSQLDEGAGMVDCMNALPISHCCFGNHECDVPHEALLTAIKTFQGTWLNSNMKGGGFGENEKLPTYDILEVASRDGLNCRRVGMLGLLCNYSYLYRDNVFNGAVPSIEPANECCARLCKHLTEEKGCDVVVPMTHQDGPEDEELMQRGRELRVPVILGGHDHCEVVDRPSSPEGAVLLKAGMDAVRVGVVDVTWHTPACEWPEVNARLLTTVDFAGDASMEQVVQKHMSKVWALDYMVACGREEMQSMVPPGTQFPLSSLGTRVGESSMATLLCTALRNALGCEVCLLDGGSVRAGSDKYEDRITMSDLKSELPFTNDTQVVQLPGSVLSEAVRTSRVKAAEKGKYAFYLHCDMGCAVDPVSHSMTTAAGAVFDPDRVYSVAVGVDLGIGAGVNEPLTEWASQNESTLPHAELARPARELLEVYFVRRLWEHLPSFDQIDTRKDGFLNPDEIREAYKQVFFGGVTDLDLSQSLAVNEMVNHLIRCLDKAGDNRVSREEYGALLVNGKPGLV